VMVRVFLSHTVGQVYDRVAGGIGGQRYDRVSEAWGVFHRGRGLKGAGGRAGV
jgi:hypothetical protein